jgi:hypothetical protein
MQSELCSFGSRPKDLVFQRSILMPKRLTIYDFVYIRKHYGSWATWQSLTENQPIPPTVKVRSRSDP